MSHNFLSSFGASKNHTGTRMTSVRRNVQTVEREMIFNAKMLFGSGAKDSEEKKKKQRSCCLSGLSRSVKGNESPVRCEWTRLTPPPPKIKCKQGLNVQFSWVFFLFLDTLFDLERKRTTSSARRNRE